MRILFTFIGGRGHLEPLIPVLHAAAAAGHDVAVAGSGRQTDSIRDLGFEAFSTSAPSVAAPAPPTRDLSPVDPVDPERDELEFAENFARRGARRHATAVLHIARAWGPDVIVRDEADLGSGLAAEVLQVPCAVVLTLAAGSLVRRDLVVGPLEELRADLGLAPDPDLHLLAGSLVLSPFPPSFRHPDVPLPAGSFSYRASVRADTPARTGPPTVYFTLGTVFNSGSGDLMERVLEGLHDFAGRVVATVGSDIEPGDLPRQPQHIRLESYVAQADLLPTCDLAISHGGSGSVLGALTHGLPTLLLPLGADQSHNAEQVTRLGVGLVLDASAATPADVRQGVTTLLEEPSFREAAERVRSEIDDLPGVEHTVPLLEALR